MVHRIIPKGAKKVGVKTFKAEKYGGRGLYKIAVQTFDEKSNGVKGTVVFTEVEQNTPQFVTILPGETNPLEKNTNSNGFLLIELNPFNEVKRTIHISAEGSAEWRSLELHGPKDEECPRCHSQRWNGFSCPNCNYPKSRK